MTYTARMFTILFIECVTIASLCVIGTAVGDDSICGKPKYIEDLKQALKEPCTPLNPLKIHYGENEIECGKAMSKEETHDQPTYLFAPSVEKDKSYSLVMVDPDAPSSAADSMKFYLHWAVSNMTGADLLTGTTSNGKVLKEYMGPSPPKDTGPHRYQFIIFEESTGGQPIKEISSSRDDFKLKDFIKENQPCSYEGLFQFNVETK